VIAKVSSHSASPRLIAVMGTCRCLFVAGLAEDLWAPLFSRRFKIVPKAGQVLPSGRLHRSVPATSAITAAPEAAAAHTAKGLQYALTQTSAPLNLKSLLYDARAYSRFRSWVCKPLLPRVPLAAGMPFLAASMRQPAMAGAGVRTPGMCITVGVHHRDGCLLPSTRLLHSVSPAAEAAHGNVVDRQAAEAGETVERCLQLRVIVQNTHSQRRYSIDFGRLGLQLRTGAVVWGEVDRLAFCDARATQVEHGSVQHTALLQGGAGADTPPSSPSSVYTFVLSHNDAVSLVASFPLQGVHNEAVALERCHSLYVPVCALAHTERVKLAPLPKCSCAGGHAGHTHTHSHSSEEEAHKHSSSHVQQAQYARRKVSDDSMQLQVPFVQSDVVWTHYKYISGHFLVLEEMDLVAGI